MEERKSIIEQDIEKRIKEHKFGDELYHYTSISTLEGILKNKELWIGNTANMNDGSEVIYYINKIKEESVKNIKNKEVVKLFDCVEKRVENEYPYAICLSKLNDNASQWERYGDNAEGVCIVFNTRNLLRLFYSHKIIINEIYYDYNVKEHKLYKIIKDYYDGETEELNEKGISDQLVALGSIHKHHSFSNEEEVRIVTLWDYIPECSHVEYKNIAGQIRSVIIVSLEELCKKKSITIEQLIDSIVLGPRTKQSIHEMKKFIENLGYNTLAEKIVRSDCPLR